MRSLRELEGGLVEDVLRNDGAVENNGIVDEKAVFAIGLDEDGERTGLRRGVITGPPAAVSGANVGVGALVRSEGIEFLLFGLAASGSGSAQSGFGGGTRYLAFEVRLCEGDVRDAGD